MELEPLSMYRGVLIIATDVTTPLSWNPNNGHDYDTDELIEMIEENSLADVTISGGDSLTFQYEETLKLVKTIKE